MASTLSDLPTDSVFYAIEAWSRGESKHLSAYQQDRTRIGIFFPKPAELREIAKLHAREEAGLRATQDQLAEWDRWRADKEAHPENYPPLGEALKRVLEAKGRDDVKETA